MAKQKEKFEAVQLRKSGKSIGTIAKTLDVSKSTVSFWCKDISLTPKQIDKIAIESKHHATASLLKSSEKQREQRQNNIIQAQLRGKKMVGKLLNRDIFMLGLGLYWGEGYKKGSHELGFTNSDPLMIPIYIRWLKITYGVSKERLILRISINQSHEHRADEVLKYWSDLLQIPITQFTKTSFIKSSSKKQFYTEKHYGTLRVKARNGTMLRHEVLGAIASIN
ncbi:MAG: hypothetical protein RLZZ230_509 [Candidatus Parcubacteria bacterium]|jgi:hypothetical protein